jgi:ubiquinone/menaquinone biosynthesis C-methylase UbiE
MPDSIDRFSSRVDNYVKYRPGYPREIIDLLVAECGLTPESVVADIGSGTGIVAELFLRHGNKVYGVEPNREMREAAERLLKAHANFKSIDGKAEATTLDGQSVDFVTAGQAFHWFDQEKARKEFTRILQPQGWAVLIWNERRLDSTPFLRAYEDLLLKYGTDYERVRHENVYEDIRSFFAPESFKFADFDNLQTFDFEGLKGRIFSASYTPEPGHPSFDPMLEQLLAIFSTHQKSGKVTIEYDTRVYYGQLGK